MPFPAPQGKEKMLRIHRNLLSFFLMVGEHFREIFFREKKFPVDPIFGVGGFPRLSQFILYHPVYRLIIR